MATWRSIRYFEPREFDSPDAPGSGREMDLGFVKKLDRIRGQVGTPLVITSGYRTTEHNQRVGGYPRSAHLKGHAADIACTTPRLRFLLVTAAAFYGITRIGIGSTFVHLDDDRALPPGVLWLY